MEYTKIFSQNKFCHLNINPNAFGTNRIFSKLLKHNVNKGKEYNLLEKCAFKNCFFTCDRDLLEYSDAILFHETDLKADIVKEVTNVEDPVMVRNFMNNYVSFPRDSSQIWILWDDEANQVIKAVDYFNFNYTITYNSKAEVSYGTYGTYGPLRIKFNVYEIKEKIKNEFNARKKGKKT